jgi:AcrR family transcriptional regulator
MTDNDRAAIQAALARVRSSTPAELPAALDALAAAVPAGPAPVVIEPTPEPELDQTDLANALVRDVAEELDAHTLHLVRRWLVSRGLALGMCREGDLRGLSLPADLLTAAAQEHLRLHGDLASALSEAIGPMVFHRAARGWVKNQTHRHRVY